MTEPVRAAGGLLERRDGPGVRIAVVHRTRYRDRSGNPGDLVLPKGKAEPGEDLAATALREVLEETGCRGRPSGPVFRCRYEVDGRPKEVTFLAMELVEEGNPPDAAEVAAVHWLTPSETVARLTYDTEREIVRRAFGVE